MGDKCRKHGYDGSMSYYYHYDRIDLRVDVMFCRLSLTLFQVMQQLLHVQMLASRVKE